MTVRDVQLQDADGNDICPVVDYNKLSNQPQINNVTLAGNKTSEDLGLMSADASNLSSAGQKVFDGQWVFLNPRVTLADALLPTANVSIDISSHLPVDTYKYEILVYSTTWGKVATGTDFWIQCRTDIMPANVIFARTVGQGTSKHATSVNTFNLVVGTQRTITVAAVSNPPTGAGYMLILLGYRRIGTNS